ncbi:MAG: NAD(P)-dependent oxidoreductase [Clostridiales bacterium]|nr:NAD(P)-dependent oxidoreductase [Clostridiales bacterium]
MKMFNEHAETILGFIGLGAMGLPMAHNILKKGDETLLVYDVATGRAQRLAAHGALIAASPEELMRQADILFLCLPTNALVAETLEKALEHLKPGAGVVDFSSTAPGILQAAHRAGQAKGLMVVDAPVSGGSWGAEAGSLTVMCGGDEAAFARVSPYLNRVGTSVSHIGPTGAGDLTKIINNMLVGIHLDALAEGLALAKKAGLDPGRVFEAIRHGFAASAVMEAKAPLMLSHDFEPRARLAVHLKDLDNARDTAQALGVDIPLSLLTREHMAALCDQGFQDLDQAAMIKGHEERMGVDISKP